MLQRLPRVAMHPSNLPRSPLGHISGAAAMWGHREATQPPPEIAPVLAWAQTAHPDPKPAEGCLALIRAACQPPSQRAPRAPKPQQLCRGEVPMGVPMPAGFCPPPHPSAGGPRLPWSPPQQQGKASWVPPSRPGPPAWLPPPPSPPRRERGTGMPAFNAAPSARAAADGGRRGGGSRGDGGSL